MHSKESSVTIVVPVYNVEKYLRRCVDSLLRQTVLPLEIILVDDGSPDGSGAICDEYAAKCDCIKAIHKPNSGLSSARHAGWQQAKGKQICFVDSDDYVADTYIEKLAAPFSDPNVELSICAWSNDNGGKITAASLPYAASSIANADIAEQYILPIVGAISEPKAINVPGFVPLRMYTTNLLKDTDFVSEREYFTEDIILNILYAKRMKGRIAIINEPLYYYCINPGSLTLRYREKGFEMRLACYRLCKRLLSTIESNPKDKQARLNANLSSAIMYGVFNAGRLSGYAQFRKELNTMYYSDEARAALSNPTWPKASFWSRVVLLAYQTKAYLVLYTLLKIRNRL